MENNKTETTRFKKHKAGRGGWSVWVNPNHKSYLFKCCDCGLVHEMQFAVASFSGEKIKKMDKKNKDTGVVFRARRQRI